MTRERLPNRRPGLSGCFFWPLQDGRRVHLTVGFHPVSAEPKELFLRGGGQVGSERDFTLDDIAILISRLLQFGDTLPELARSLSRHPDGKPASVAGAAVDMAVTIEG